MQVISSKDNETIKYIKKLKEKKYRDETNCYIIEGIKLVKEAIEENAEIKYIVICEDCEEVVKLEQNLLYDIAKKYCINAMLIENAEELKFESMNPVDKIGIMAGASTPKESIEKVVKTIENIFTLHEIALPRT